MLNEAEGAAGLLAVDQEAHAEGEQLHGLPLIGAEQVGDRCRHRRTPFD
jgi:hypothetical protein